MHLQRVVGLLKFTGSNPSRGVERRLALPVECRIIRKADKPGSCRSTPPPARTSWFAAENGDQRPAGPWSMSAFKTFPNAGATWAARRRRASATLPRAMRTSTAFPPSWAAGHSHGGHAGEGEPGGRTRHTGREAGCRHGNEGRQGQTAETGREGIETAIDRRDAVLYIMDMKGETTR